MSDDLEVCWKCQGSGMMLGDNGDPCICSHCKYDGVAPREDDAEMSDDLDELTKAEQRGYANAMEAERKLHEDRIEELVKENYQLTISLEMCYVGWDQALDEREAAEAKLTKAVAFIRRHIPDSVYEQRQRANAFLAELKGK
jgi:hypothetical protein